MLNSEKTGGTLVVTMSWLSKRNALGPEEARALTEAINTGDDGEITSMILTGEGAFCSGGDLPTFAKISRDSSEDDIRERVYGDVQGILRALRSIKVPTIAAVDGPAIGLGMDIALACDMRFVGPDGYLRQGWASAGLIPALGGAAFMTQMAPSQVWPQIVEQPRVDAEMAFANGIGEIGLPNALEAALSRAQGLNTLGRDVLQDYVSVARDLRWPDSEYFEKCSEIQAHRIKSERFRSFAEQVLSRSRNQQN